MIAYNAPQHHNAPQHCPPPPGLSWSSGSLSALTDDAVEKWLAKNHPEAARTIRREARIVFEQQQAERSLEAPTQARPSAVDPTLASTPIADLVNPPKHWAAALYPGFGSVEICEMVAALLTPSESAALRLQFADGKTGGEISEALDAGRTTVYGLLKSARVKLYQAAKAGQLPIAEDQEETQRLFDDVQQLFRETPTVYRKLSHSRPKRRAYVCDCGHHLTLTNADLDHRRVDPRAKAPGSKVIPERRFLCPHCGKAYTESDWPSIRA